MKMKGQEFVLLYRGVNAKSRSSLILDCKKWAGKEFIGGFQDIWMLWWARWVWKPCARSIAEAYVEGWSSEVFWSLRSTAKWSDERDSRWGNKANIFDMLENRWIHCSKFEKLELGGDESGRGRRGVRRKLMSADMWKWVFCGYDGDEL